MDKKYYKLEEIVFALPQNDLRFEDLTGQSFGRLKVLGFAGQNKWRNAHWFCKCSCGNIKKIAGKSLKNGATKSCGCLSSEWTTQQNKTHGESDSVEYKIYAGIKNRCENKSQLSYSRYGGRGIKCLLTFEEFMNEVGKRPGKDYSIDRINTNGNYEAKNIRWATIIEQANNKRNNHNLTFSDKTMTMAQWARETGLPRDTIKTRKQRKWCDYHTLSLPKCSKRPRNCIKCGNGLPQSALR